MSDTTSLAQAHERARLARRARAVSAIKRGKPVRVAHARIPTPSIERDRLRFDVVKWTTEQGLTYQEYDELVTWLGLRRRVRDV